MLAKMFAGQTMRTCRQEATGQWKKANIILMCWNYYHALQIYCKNLFDSSVYLKVDSTTAVSWINKQTAPNELGTLQHSQCQKYMLPILSQRRIRQPVLRLAMSKITQSGLSNMMHLPKLKQNQVNLLQTYLYTGEAIRSKAFYFSCPGPLASGVHAFSFNWSSNPCGCQVQIYLDLNPYKRKLIPYLPKKRLGDACKSRIFQVKLQALFSKNGDQGLVGNMISVHRDGCSFVVKRTLVPMKQL